MNDDLIDSPKRKLGTFSKSLRLRDTKIPFTDSVIAAIRKSCVPMRIL
jgi:hypothetical protein